jgi:CHAT domain-containing protein
VLAGHPELRSRDGVQLLYSEVLKLSYIDVDKAERLAECAEWLAADLGDPVAQAFALRCTGHVLFSRSNYDLAFENYSEALTFLDAAGEELEMGRTLATGTQVLIYLGRYEEAFAWAERARQIYERHHDDLRLARLGSNVGNILYRQDRYQEAIEAYTAAYERLKTFGNARDIAAVLSNMSVCYTSLGNFSRALETYEAAREHCRIHGLDLLTAEADYNIAYLHYLRADYLKAMDLYQQTRTHCQRTGDAYHEALCDLDEAEMYLELNFSEEGERLATRAAERFRGLGMNYETAKALMYRAVACSQQSDSRSAVRLLREARTLFVADSNKLWAAVIDLYLGLIYHDLGRTRHAWRVASKAKQALHGSLLPAKAALCELLIAQLLLGDARLDEARSTCQQAIERLKRAESKHLLFHAYAVLGQIEENCGDIESAYQWLQSARAQAENLLTQLRGEQVQVSFLKDKLAIYESLVVFCLERLPEREAVEESFRYIEEAKSRKLAELMTFPPNSGDAWGESQAGRIHELRRELDWYYKQLDTAALRKDALSPRTVESFRRQAREREVELVQSVARLRSAERDTAVLTGETSLNLDTIRDALPAGAVLLQYFQIRGALHVCIVGKNSLRMLPLANAAVVRRELRLMQFQLTRARSGQISDEASHNAWTEATNAHLRALYDKLIAPIRPLLEADHLVVAPHGLLHHVPFHALYDGSQYLIDAFTVSYTPSASVYALCRSRKHAASRPPLVMGVPDERAPHIEEEARKVAAILPEARLVLGQDATRRLLRESGSGSRHIHIATHGVFRIDNPMFSSIRLGDGHLSLFDLYQMPLAADLVTLSGCSTGLNVVVGGDELFGLMRGLLSAGAGSLLVSLWDVFDRSSADFMAVFYRTLCGGATKAESVRTAILAVRQEYRHPYYWAPFILVGNHLD